MRWRDAALAAALLGGCYHDVAVGPPVVAPTPHAVSALHVRAAIFAGLNERGFVVESEQPGRVMARLERPQRLMRIRVLYAADRYAIVYEETQGLGARLDRRGELRVPATYHRQVDALRAAIDGAFERALSVSTPSPPVATTPAPPAPGGAASALGPPPAEAPATGPASVVPGPAPAPPPPTGAPVEAVPPLDPEAPAEEPRYSTHPMWELVGVGAAVFGASWVGNIAAAAAIGGSVPEYIGLSVVPIIGPWAQLPALRWSDHPRWAGWFHPVMGLTQLIGLGVFVAGLVVPVRDDLGVARADAVRWTLAPAPREGGAELRLDLTF